MIKQNCPICDSKQLGLKNKLFDDRYGYPGLFSLIQCFKCGHLFLDSNFTDAQLTNLYTHYYPRTLFQIDNYKHLPEVKGFKSWFNGERGSAYTWVPRNVTVLDIGCGFGETLGYHATRGCSVYGVEADENIKRVAQKFGFNVHVGLFDPNLYESAFFDYVTMDQVIEHVADPIGTFKGISKILKKNGTLIVSAPNANGWGAKVFGRKWINWHTPYHLNFFTKKSIYIAAEEVGLRIVKIKTITSSEWLYYQFIHLFFYPKAGSPSIFWTPGQALTFKTKLILKFFSLLHKTKINHLITRLFDSLSMGDCFIVFLTPKDE